MNSESALQVWRIHVVMNSDWRFTIPVVSLLPVNAMSADQLNKIYRLRWPPVQQARLTSQAAYPPFLLFHSGRIWKRDSGIDVAC